MVRALALVASLVAIGCSRQVAPLVTPGASAVALTGGLNTSMIYVARTSSGVLAIDLGWWGHADALARALRDLGARPSDVTMVFLTHSHRDHLAAWRDVRQARFHVAEAEQPLLVGDSAHGGWVPRLVDRVRQPRIPRPGDLMIQTFSRDTAYALGADTLRAYIVAGHTRGTTVYLFRGILFLGDAVTWSRRGGFAPAAHRFSNDAREAAVNLARLWPRLPTGAVKHVCTAHARCTPFSQGFLDDVAR